MKKFPEFFLGFGDGNKQGSNHSKIIQKLFSTNYRGVFVKHLWWCSSAKMVNG